MGYWIWKNAWRHLFIYANFRWKNLTINSDYEAKRSKNLILDAPKLTIVKNGVFYNWLKHKNKLGGQNKIQRLNENRDFIEEIKKLNL